MKTMLKYGCGVIIGILISILAISCDDEESPVSQVTASETFQIIASADRGGYIDPEGTIVVQRGSNQTFEIDAEEHYEISDVEVSEWEKDCLDDSCEGKQTAMYSVGAVSLYTFSDIDRTYTIHAYFEEVEIEVEVPDESTGQCDETVQQGTDAPETHVIELGQTSGTFQFEFDTRFIEDQLIVTYENNVLFDSGCVGTNGFQSVDLTYSGNSSTVTVEVIPNCTGTVNTFWEFIVHCPE